jgi:hypothetical protein
VSSFELRPLSLGELLDRAFLLYRRNFRLFAGIMVIPACLTVPVRFLQLRRRTVPFPWSKSAPQAHDFAYAVGSIFIYWIMYAIAEAATTNAVGDQYLGRNSTISEAYGKIRGRLWRAIGVTLSVYVWTLVLIFFSLVLGMVVAIVLMDVFKMQNTIKSPTFTVLAIIILIAGFFLGILLSVRYTLSLPALLLEDLKARAAVRRSVQLSHGRRGQIFVAVLLGLLVTYSAAILFQGPVYLLVAGMGIKGSLPAWLSLFQSMLGALGMALSTPVMMIVLVLCYYDQRIRKEGFDLQHMMTSLPESKPANAASVI